MATASLPTAGRDAPRDDPPGVGDWSRVVVAFGWELWWRARKVTRLPVISNATAATRARIVRRPGERAGRSGAPPGLVESSLGGPATGTSSGVTAVGVPLASNRYPNGSCAPGESAGCSVAWGPGGSGRVRGSTVPGRAQRLGSSGEH